MSACFRFGSPAATVKRSGLSTAPGQSLAISRVLWKLIPGLFFSA
jgi:hypothetical protein